ncbi:MAG: hypothetical protein LBL90_11355 [Prevotellaceae bacterium]|jgi:hypothetical protein|nr:hypothetical protein [Prevotellaceae bacterium]
MKVFVLFLWLVLAVACNNATLKNIEAENKRLKEELELFKNLENNRQKAMQHADTRMFKLENERDILSVLFDTEDFDVNERAVWTPNFDERLNFPVSYDGFCYTTMDKVLLYNDNFARAIIVFGTYEIMDDGQPNDGHSSAPMLSLAYFTQRGANEWELSTFRKSFVHHGSWGEMGDVEIKQVGKQKFVLDLSWGYSNMGEATSWTSYYSIPNFEVIFGIATAHSFTSFEDDDGKAYDYETRLTVKPSDKEYFDIIAETTGTKPNNKEDEEVVISANNDQLFYYNEQAGVYVEKITYKY